MFFNCLVQQNQIPTKKRDELAVRLTNIAGELFGKDPTEVNIGWVDIEEGSGFTGGQPSTTSLVMAVVPDGTAQEKRESLLSAVCDAWMEISGCSINEVVASAADESLMARVN